METTRLFDALLRIKNNISSSKDELLPSISREFNISYDALDIYYDLLDAILKEDSCMTKAGDRKWTDEEHQLLGKVLTDLQGVLSKNKVFESLSPILERTQGGISFYYYHGFKERDIPLTFEPVSMEEQNDDLFSDLETIATNLELLKGVDLNYLFKSLANLSSLAVDNQNLSEIEELEEELALKEATVLAYEKKLYEKDLEVSRLENELHVLKRETDYLKEVVQNFESLSSGKKLSKLREYSSQIKDIILKDEVETA